MKLSGQNCADLASEAITSHNRYTNQFIEHDQLVTNFKTQ